MSSVPSVSIGMPIYNGQAFLEEALDSILGQTFEDFELIISDNASIDRTEAICRRYAAKDARVRYFRNQVNLGAAKNHNRVFELSSGDYFKWAAADDVCAPDFLAMCVAVLNRHSEVILCYPRTHIIDGPGNVIRQNDDGLNLRTPSVCARFDHAINRISMCNPVYGVVRSNVLRKTPLIQNFLSSDKVLLAELTLYGQFYEIPEYLFFRRRHPGDSMTNKSWEERQEWFDPLTKGKIFLFVWTHLSRHLATIRRARLKRSVKLRLVCIVLRRGMTLWRSLVREPLSALKQIALRISRA